MAAELEARAEWLVRRGWQPSGPDWPGVLWVSATRAPGSILTTLDAMLAEALGLARDERKNAERIMRRRLRG